MARTKRSLYNNTECIKFSHAKTYFNYVGTYYHRYSYIYAYGHVAALALDIHGCTERIVRNVYKYIYIYIYIYIYMPQYRWIGYDLTLFL